MRDEVLELARAANIATYINIESHLVGNILEKFAELVAAAEREACAKVCDGWPDYNVQGLAEAIRARGQK